MKIQFLKYLQTKAYSPNTVRGYGITLSQFEDFLKNNELSVKNVCFEDIERFIANFKPRTAQQKFSALTKFFKWLKRQNLILRNPMDEVEYPVSQQKYLPTWLESYELNQIRNEIQADQSWEGIRDRAIIELLFNTGIRNSELRNLILDDLYMRMQTVKFIAKGGRERILPLNQDAIHYLRIWLSVRGPQEDRHLFLKKNGMWFKHISELNRIIHMRTKHLRKNVSSHQFRHSLAMRLQADNVSPITIQNVLGHKSLATVGIYARAQSAQVRKALDGLVGR